jgi:hypothetical protein
MNAATWKMPALMGLLSTVGLVSALLADGIWDALSWAGLGIPVVVAAWYAWRPAGRGAPRS